MLPGSRNNGAEAMRFGDGDGEAGRCRTPAMVSRAGNMTATADLVGQLSGELPKIASPMPGQKRNELLLL